MKRIETLVSQAVAHLRANEYRSGERNGVSGMEIARAVDRINESEKVLRRAFG